MAARGLLALLGTIASLLLFTPTCASLEPRQAEDVLFSVLDVFVPPADYFIPKVLYGRTVQLADGTLLATW